MHDIPLPVAAPALPRDAARLDDAGLAARAAAGDEAAFEAIMRRHNRLLFRTARSILKDDAETEDALQEAYLLAWHALPRFRGEARLSTWLVRIVVNEALGRRRRRRLPVAVGDAGGAEGDGEAPQDRVEDDPSRQPEGRAMRAELRRLMEARIDGLPDAFRSVFVLRAVEELSVEEVAAALGLPEATVRTRFFRARAQLREGLSRDVGIALGDAFSFDGARCDRIVARVMARLR